MSSSDWPYLTAPPFVWDVFQLRKSVSDFTGALSPRDLSHLLKSRSMPYARSTEHFRSFTSSIDVQTPQLRRLLSAFLSTMLGISAGSTTVAPCFFNTSIASLITFF